MSGTDAYAELKERRARIHRLEHVQSIATWDRMTNMPRGGAGARAAAQGELAALVRSIATDPSLDALIADAEGTTLAPDDVLNLALMRRERVFAQAVPEVLLKRKAEAVGTASAAWAAARKANDWPLFAIALASLLNCVREEAARIGHALGLSPYDALLDRYDRGLRHEYVATLFGDIASWLPDAIGKAMASQADIATIAPVGPFPAERQRQLCVTVMERLGFDFDGGRLDTSLHPFTGGVPEDVRLTTRLREDDCLSGLLGIVHETGHGCYQAGLPRPWLGQPIGEPCSASMHEAQALSFERQIAPTTGFVAILSELLSDAFGAQDAFAPDNLRRLMTRVRPGPIRVDADEVTYPAHIIARVEIEAALIGGSIEVADIPAWWDERMQRLLGIDTRGKFTNGPLQDMHWSQGMFGYFPAYLLGATIAAQLADAFRRERDIETDTLDGYPEWLATHIWPEGSRFTTEDLVGRATGRPLGTEAFRAHIQRRYLR